MVDSSFNEVELVDATKNETYWTTFIRLCISYLRESWPEEFETLNNEAFYQYYEAKLRRRLQDSTSIRGLFLIQKHDKFIGISNNVIHHKEKIVSTLHTHVQEIIPNTKTILEIAELYILPSYRKQGYASEALNKITKWGKYRQAEIIWVEVDKDLQGSNSFWWKSLEKLVGISLKKLEGTERNYYFSEIFSDS